MVDWNAIRAEYIGGGISQRKLAEKYGVSNSTLAGIAAREGWKKLRDETASKVLEKSVQKQANWKAKNAEMKERIRYKLLKKLESEIDKLPKNTGSQTIRTVTKGTAQGGKKEEETTIYKLKDLTSAFRDLTDEEIKRDKLELDKKKFDNENW